MIHWICFDFIWPDTSLLQGSDAATHDGDVLSAPGTVNPQEQTPADVFVFLLDVKYHSALSHHRLGVF